MLNISGSAISVQLGPGGANHEPHAEQLLQAHYVYAMPLFGYSVAPEQNIFLLAAANITQFSGSISCRAGIIIFFSPQALQHLLVNNFAAPTIWMFRLNIYIMENGNV
jgi:hypothetical protein